VCLGKALEARSVCRFGRCRGRVGGIQTAALAGAVLLRMALGLSAVGDGGARAGMRLSVMPGRIRRRLIWWRRRWSGLACGCGGIALRSGQARTGGRRSALP
jgi:hypothetical protein